MEWIGYNIHREVNFVNEECTLEEFGRYYNPGFKAELGHGYFEFTEREYLKPQKNVIVMDKVNDNNDDNIHEIIKAFSFTGRKTIHRSRCKILLLQLQIWQRRN